MYEFHMYFQEVESLSYMKIARPCQAPGTCWHRLEQLISMLRNHSIRILEIVILAVPVDVYSVSIQV
jgi:hypothetical protein